MLTEAGKSLVLAFALCVFWACEKSPELREWTPADHAYPPGLTSERAAPIASQKPSPRPEPAAEGDAEQQKNANDGGGP